ncbi:MAG: DUF1571 domain-containing protein [Bacteroidia bacterium]
MHFIKLSLLVVFMPLFWGAAPIFDRITSREIIERMLDSIERIETQQYTLKSTERVDGRLLFAESRVKIHESPKKIYFNNYLRGIEILWVQGQNNGNAIVKTRTLPLMNLDLDPLGGIMRKNQHHTLFDLGFTYIGKTIANVVLKAPKEFDKYFTYAGTLTWDNIECYQMIVNYPDYKYVEYISQENETVTDISKRFATSDFKIRDKNNLSNYFGTIKKGKKLLIPVPYANKAIMYIDKNRFLPINLKVYDEGGLYEAYEFYNVIINRSFEANEFSKTYKSYGF